MKCLEVIKYRVIVTFYTQLKNAWTVVLYYYNLVFDLKTCFAPSGFTMFMKKKDMPKLFVIK
jgi:hypothetical protein